MCITLLRVRILGGARGYPPVGRKEHLPVKSKRMQERRQALHQDENDDGEERPGAKEDEQQGALVVLLLLGSQTHPHQPAPQHLGELRMRQRERPQS